MPSDSARISGLARPVVPDPQRQPERREREGDQHRVDGEGDGGPGGGRDRPPRSPGADEDDQERAGPGEDGIDRGI